MTHRKQAHGGQATQAQRRGEQWLLCNECGQRHGRSHTYPVPDYDERLTPWRLLGLCVFVAFMFAVLLYALPVVLIAMAGGPA